MCADDYFPSCYHKPTVHVSTSSLWHSLSTTRSTPFNFIPFNSMLILRSIPMSFITSNAICFIDRSRHVPSFSILHPFLQDPSFVIRRIWTGCSNLVRFLCRVWLPAFRDCRWCLFMERSLWQSTTSSPCPMFVLRNSWRKTIFTGLLCFWKVSILF